MEHRPSHSLGRKLLLAAVASTLGLLVLLGGTELVLRIVGYGYSPRFVRQITLPSGERVWRENRWFTAPYFSPELVRRPFPFRLPVSKPAHGYRMVVLGSSAAMGDPEPSFSISRTLEVMLRHSYPEIHFEVVNAGVTAINSHVARRVATDCAQFEPDLFVVYEGHNEVIGPFGPAGVFAPFLRTPALVRSAVWAKGTRTGQLITALGRRLAGGDRLRADWGGMSMFLQQQIAYDDPRLESVRSNFRQNLIAIAHSAQSVGARTLLCTVLTNQRDFAPFLSQHRRGLSRDDLARWDAAVQTARTAEQAHRLADAESAYRAALAIDDDHAELAFRYGRFLLQADRLPEAQTFLQRALNLDTLRFRTDAALNREVRAARDASGPQVELVDLAASLAARSEGGIPGDEFLYEHVHLTLRGTYEVCRELFGRVSTDLLRRGLISKEVPATLSYDQVRTALGYTAYEQTMIALELLNRFRAPPFSGQADHSLRTQTWQQRADHANALLSRPEALPALREIYRQAIEQSPADWVLARNAGAMFVARQSPAEALPLLERARAFIDDDVDTLVPLGWAHRALGHTAEARATFDAARRLEPKYPNLPEEVR